MAARLLLVAVLAVAATVAYASVLHSLLDPLTKALGA